MGLLAANAQVQPVVKHASVVYTYNRGAGYILRDSTHYTYNPGNPRQYDPIAGRWSYDVHDIYKFPNGMADRVSSTLFTFTPQGKVSTMEYGYVYAGVYDPSGMDINTYDANGNIIATEHKYWDAGMFEPHRNYLFTYNANNQLTTRISQEWDGAVTQYFSVYRDEYVYNTAHQLVEELNQMGAVGNWGTVARRTYTWVGGYNAEMQEVEYLGGGRENRRLTQYIYDALGNRIQEEQKTWRDTVWENSQRFLYTHDTKGNVLTTANAHWRNGAYDPQMLLIDSYIEIGNRSHLLSRAVKTWNSVTGSYSSNRDSIYNYYYDNSLAVAAMPAPAAAIRVYPLPANAYVTLSIDLPTQPAFTARLLDVTGRLVKYYAGSTSLHQHRLDVQDIPAGNYLLQVHAGGAVAVEKLVIAR
jgi:hypothetical protein